MSNDAMLKAFADVLPDVVRAVTEDAENRTDAQTGIGNALEAVAVALSFSAMLKAREMGLSADETMACLKAAENIVSKTLIGF